MQHQTIAADWTQSIAAQRILASFAKHPPLRVNVPDAERWTTATTAYAGYRVECLQRLWNEYAAPILAHCDTTGDYDPWSDFCAGQPTVDHAIEDAALGIPMARQINVVVRGLSAEAWA